MYFWRQGILFKGWIKPSLHVHAWEVISFMKLGAKFHALVLNSLL
jgi:hypothetical protein